MIQEYGEGLEKKAKLFAELGYMNEGDMETLFGKETNDYAELVEDPTSFNNVVKRMNSILYQNAGEPIYCINMIEALEYGAFEKMAYKFQGQEETDKVISNFVGLSLEHMFHETQDIDMAELERYLPHLKSWTKYLTEEQIYDAVNVGLETSIQMVRFEREDDEDVDDYCHKIRYKLEFLKEANENVYLKLKEDLDKYSDELDLIEK